MNKINNPKLKPLAQKLRKDMTKEERHLWYCYLKQLPVTVKRQMVIGSYIVDFYIASAKLVIELDGSQHFDEAGQKYDAERTKYLEEYGLLVIRIPNNEVNENFDGVCEEIAKYLA